ncbi:unnamed protein product [Parnassius mnemosyne]|uniref:C2H2-type domain-containing protein n=1 Tax=Parnassius mnemosyne TaxID=213953 RepID=A0AAV1LDT7_9NEOP
MKQEVDIVYNKVCSACLSSDRDLVFIIGQSDIYQIFRLLMYDFVGDKFEELQETLQVCWECLALLRRFDKFKKQVHTAQETILSLKDNHENTDHTYSFSQSLSTLGLTIKNGYDFCYDNKNTIQTEWTPKIVAVSFGSNVKNELNNDEQMLESTQMLEDPNIIVKPQIVIKQEPINLQEHNKGDNKTVLSKVTISIGPLPEDRTDLSLVEDVQSNDYTEEKPDLKAGSMEYMNDEDTVAISTGSLPGDKGNASKDLVEEKADLNLYPSFEMNPYITEYMNDEAMLAFREKAKEKIQYASAAYKCDLCIIDFSSQQQVDKHCKLAHKARAGTKVCKICLVYIEEERMSYHMQSHYVRHVCRLCGHSEASNRLAQVHAQQHLAKKPPSAFINKDLKKEMNDEDLLSNTPSANSETQVLRKLSKNAVVAYKCFECDMFFQTNNTRKAHMAKYHNASSLECDLCNKVFANRSTLIRHLSTTGHVRIPVSSSKRTYSCRNKLS